jgi:UDP-N-acetylglucosamine--N-acetylmuramyl-(pentapeptide) pyrophosphoryl-undecaprenol N-acetylglucosamine transferase
MQRLEAITKRLQQLDRPIRLIAGGGGSGGHTFPAIATISCIREILEDASMELDALFVGTAEGIEAAAVGRAGTPFSAVRAGKLRRSRQAKDLLSNCRDVPRTLSGVASALRLVRKKKPDVVLCTGSYASLPTGIAARVLSRPLVIHEQTVRLGLANRLLSKGATRIAVSRPDSVDLLSRRLRARAVETGNPVRDLTGGVRDQALTKLGWSTWSPELPTVLALTGSKGSDQINRLMAEILDGLLAEANVVHQCGHNFVRTMLDVSANLPAELRGRYIVREFLGTELADTYALADLVVCRGGAGMLAEVTALRKPSIMIPLASSAGNEQQHNARFLGAAGACAVLDGSRVAAGELLKSLRDLLHDDQRRLEMAEAAGRLAQPDAARALATVVLETCASDHRLSV